MRGERTLIDKPFRYGGFLHDYSRDVEDWGNLIEDRCYCCHGEMRNCYSPNGTLYKRNYPYIAVFKITRGTFKGNNRFHFLCRACAYSYGRGVIEMDGETYYDSNSFREIHPGDGNLPAYKEPKYLAGGPLT